MSIGLTGFLLTALGTVLVVFGYLYFDWLMIPGGLFAFVGAALTSGTTERVLSVTSHSISDSFENGAQTVDPGRVETEEHQDVNGIQYPFSRGPNRHVAGLIKGHHSPAISIWT